MVYAMSCTRLATDNGSMHLGVCFSAEASPKYYKIQWSDAVIIIDVQSLVLQISRIVVQMTLSLSNAEIKCYETQIRLELDFKKYVLISVESRP